jgi:hypothetical protein
MPHSPLTPEPLSPEYRGEGRYGFEEWTGLAVFCIESWCSVSVRKCREVCARFQVVKIDHPPNGFWWRKVKARKGLGRGGFREWAKSRKHFWGGFLTGGERRGAEGWSRGNGRTAACRTENEWANYSTSENRANVCPNRRGVSIGFGDHRKASGLCQRFRFAIGLLFRNDRGGGVAVFE